VDSPKVEHEPKVEHAKRKNHAVFGVPYLIYIYIYIYIPHYSIFILVLSNCYTYNKNNDYKDYLYCLGAILIIMDSKSFVNREFPCITFNCHIFMIIGSCFNKISGKDVNCQCLMSY